MAHGTPDYGVTAGAETTHQLTDLGELAVRLGSPVSFDRRGDVIWWDDFECGGVAWFLARSGAGAVAAVSAARALNGANSLELTCGSTIGQGASAGSNRAFPVRSRLGFELHLLNASANYHFTALMALQDATSDQESGVRLDITAQTLAYLNAAGGYTVFATGINVPNDPTLFHQLKLVIDAVNAKYVRVGFDDKWYDLSAAGLYVPAASGAPLLALSMAHAGNDGANHTLYVDDVIVTQNEPA